MREQHEPCVIICRPGVPASEIIAELDREDLLGDHKVIQWGTDDAVLQLGSSAESREIMEERGGDCNLYMIWLDSDRDVWQLYPGDEYQGRLKPYNPGRAIEVPVED